MKDRDRACGCTQGGHAATLSGLTNQPNCQTDPNQTGRTPYLYGSWAPHQTSFLLFKFFFFKYVKDIDEMDNPILYNYKKRICFNFTIRLLLSKLLPLKFLKN